jgi:hypothetical protein
MIGGMNRRLVLGLIALAAAAAGPALAGESKDKKKAGGDSYIPVQTLTAYTIKPSGRRGVLTVDCGLDIPDATLRDRAQLLLPRLRAAYVQSVQIYAGGLPAGYPPNVEFLSRTLQRSTDQILGKPGARLLLGAVILN